MQSSWLAPSRIVRHPAWRRGSWRRQPAATENLRPIRNSIHYYENVHASPSGRRKRCASKISCSLCHGERDRLRLVARWRQVGRAVGLSLRRRRHTPTSSSAMTKRDASTSCGKSRTTILPTSCVMLPTGQLVHRLRRCRCGHRRNRVPHHRLFAAAAARRARHPRARRRGRLRRRPNSSCPAMPKAARRAGTTSRGSRSPACRATAAARRARSSC